MVDGELKSVSDILIVDDTQANLDVLSKVLKKEGFNVRAAISGKLALMSAKAAPPDLILLDVKMPEMDGYEVCNHLKENDDTCDIPIIFISAMDQVIDKVRAFKKGGVDYVTKPFQIDEVIARISTHLTIRKLQKNLEEKNDQLEKANLELHEALDSVKILKGFIPICAHCKMVRNDKGFWQQVEEYVQKHSDAEFSHGICPTCIKTLYPKTFDKMNRSGFFDNKSDN